MPGFTLVECQLTFALAVWCSPLPNMTAKTNKYIDGLAHYRFAHVHAFLVSCGTVHAFVLFRHTLTGITSIKIPKSTTRDHLNERVRLSRHMVPLFVFVVAVPCGVFYMSRTQQVSAPRDD